MLHWIVAKGFLSLFIFLYFYAFKWKNELCIFLHYCQSEHMALLQHPSIPGMCGQAVASPDIPLTTAEWKRSWRVGALWFRGFIRLRLKSDNYLVVQFCWQKYYKNCLFLMRDLSTLWLEVCGQWWLCDFHVWNFNQTELWGLTVFFFFLKFGTWLKTSWNISKVDKLNTVSTSLNRFVGFHRRKQLVMFRCSEICMEKAKSRRKQHRVWLRSQTKKYVWLQSLHRELDITSIKAVYLFLFTVSSGDSQVMLGVSDIIFCNY